MTKIVIDFNRSLDPKLFERCIKNDLPKITTDIVFMLSFSDNPQTEYNSLIITNINVNLKMYKSGNLKMYNFTH